MGFHYGDGFYEGLRVSVGDICNQFVNLLIQAASRLGLALRHSRIARPGPTNRRRRPSGRWVRRRRPS